MGSDLSVVCRSCSRRVKMEDVVFDDVRSAYVCEACFASTHKKPKSFSRSPLVDEAIKSVSDLKNSLVKYTCSNCKYHFARQKDKTISVCPYCGSNKLEILNSSASSIISES